MKDYSFNKEIKSYEELEEYIGLPIYFWYDDYHEPFFAWIKTVTKLKPPPYALEEKATPMKGIYVYGLNSLMMIKSYSKEEKFIYDNDDVTPQTSNAQLYARTLTREEYKMYVKKTAHRRLKLYKK